MTGVGLTQQQPRTPWIGRAAWLLGMASLSGLVLAPALIYPYVSDMGLFVAVSERLLAGDALYVDVVDHKPPAIFLQEALRLLVLGHSVLAGRVAELLVLIMGAVATGLAVERLSARLSSPSPVPSSRPSLSRQTLLAGLLGTLTFSALVGSSLWGLGERGQVEFHQTAFIMVGVAAMLHLPDHRRAELLALLAGAAMAWAAWLKPQAVLITLLGFVIIARLAQPTTAAGGDTAPTTPTRPSPTRLALCYALGVAVISGGIVVFLLWSGSLGAFLTLLFRHIPAYLEVAIWTPADILPHLARNFLETPRALVVLALWLVGLVALARERRVAGDTASNGLWLSLLLTGAGLWSYVAGKFGWFYQAVVIVPGVALPVAIGAHRLMFWALRWFERRRSAARSRRVVVGSVAAGVAMWLIVTPSFVTDAKDLSGWLTGQESLASLHGRRGDLGDFYSYRVEREVAAQVRAILPAEGTLFVLGFGSTVYALSHRRPAGRQLVTLFGDMPAYALKDEFRAEILATVRDAKPDVLLLRLDDVFSWFGIRKHALARAMADPDLAAELRQHYRPVRKFAGRFLLTVRCPGLACAAAKGRATKGPAAPPAVN